MKTNLNISKLSLALLTVTLSSCGTSEFSSSSEFARGTSPKASLTSDSGPTHSPESYHQDPTKTGEGESDPKLSPNGEPSGSSNLVHNEPESTPQQSNGGTPGNGGSGGNGSVMVCPAKPAKGWDTCEAEKKVRTGINKCLALWGTGTPFNSSSPYRNLGASVNVLGFGPTIEDTNLTAAPELVVIPVSVNVLTIAKYRLLNPNAWYCMIADVSVGAIISVDLNKNAHLADSRADVRVLAVGSNGPAVVDVHVLSAVKVRRVD